MDNPLTTYELASSSPNRSAGRALESIVRMPGLHVHTPPQDWALLKGVLIGSNSIQRQRITHHASCCTKAGS